MNNSEPATTPAPDLNKVPQPPEADEPPLKKPSKPFLVPTRPKATFLWPPESMCGLPIEDKFDS
jgi:hypothetical protein